MIGHRAKPCQTAQEKEQGSMSNQEEQDVSLMALDQYIRQVRWLEPLTTEEEAQLLARIERGKHEKRQPQPNAWRLFLAQAARERLVEGYLPWVIHLAKEYVSRARGMQLLDLLQEGNVGLLHAIEHNDVSKRLDRNMLYADGAIKLANIERPNGLKTSRILANAKKLRYA